MYFLVIYYNRATPINPVSLPEAEEWVLINMGLGLIGFKLRNRESQDQELLTLLANAHMGY
jgi:hypothetical protein